MVLTFLVPIHSSGEDGCVNRRFRLLIGLIDESVQWRIQPPGSIPGRGITFMLPTPTDMCSRGAAVSALGLQRRGRWIESIEVSSFSFDHKQIISCVLRRQSWHVVISSLRFSSAHFRRQRIVCTVVSRLLGKREVQGSKPGLTSFYLAFSPFLLAAWDQNRGTRIVHSDTWE